MKESGRIYDHCYARNEIYRILNKELRQDDPAETVNYDRLIYDDPLFHNLQMYGFVEGESVESFRGRTERVMFFSNKMYRYRYWLDFNGKLPATVSIVRT